MTLSDINLDWIQNPDKNIPICNTVCQAQKKIHKTIDLSATLFCLLQEYSNIVLCMKKYTFTLGRLQFFKVFYEIMKITVPSELLLLLFLS